MNTEKKWQRFRWKTYGRWSKVHVREWGYDFSLCGRYAIDRYAELQEVECSVTCSTCVRIAQARNLVGWND